MGRQRKLPPITQTSILKGIRKRLPPATRVEADRKRTLVRRRIKRVRPHELGPQDVPHDE